MRLIVGEPDKAWAVLKWWSCAAVLCIVAIPLSYGYSILLVPAMFVLAPFLEVYINYYTPKEWSDRRFKSRFWRSVIYAFTVGISLCLLDVVALLIGALAGAVMYLMCGVTAILAEPVLDRLREFWVHGTCRQCGYDLQGLPEPRCPECGTSFASEWRLNRDSTTE